MEKCVSKSWFWFGCSWVLYWPITTCRKLMQKQCKHRWPFTLGWKSSDSKYIAIRYYYNMKKVSLALVSHNYYENCMRHLNCISFIRTAVHVAQDSNLVEATGCCAQGSVTNFTNLRLAVLFKPTEYAGWQGFKIGDIDWGIKWQELCLHDLSKLRKGNKW